jgi:hypothetical protein
MFDANAVSEQLKLVAVERDTVEEVQHHRYECAVQVQCSGSTWNYTQPGQWVTVAGITVTETEWGVDVSVRLAEAQQLVYEDAAFAAAVSSLLNLTVDYTEQGMQDFGLVSMEH